MVGKRFTRRGDAPDEKYPIGIDDNGVSLTYKDCLFLLNNYYEGYCDLQKRYHELLNENQHLRHVIVTLDSLDWDIQWLKNNIKNNGIECANNSFTITVTEKHILGNDYSAYSGQLFILTDNHVSNSIGDVLVKSEDYYKIHIGDTVTVSMPDKYGYCNVLKINNQENTE